MKDYKRKVRSLLRIVFGRTAYMVLFLLIQMFVLFGIIRWLRDYSLYVYGALIFLGGVTCIYIINKHDNPSFKLGWIIPILVFPVFGTLLYIMVEADLGSRFYAKRANQLVKDSRGSLRQAHCHAC